MQQLKGGSGCTDAVLSSNTLRSEDFRLAMKGWKLRINQLRKQQLSATELYEEVVSVNILHLLSKQIRI